MIKLSDLDRCATVNGLCNSDGCRHSFVCKDYGGLVACKQTEMIDTRDGVSLSCHRDGRCPDYSTSQKTFADAFDRLHDMLDQSDCETCEYKDDCPLRAIIKDVDFGS